MKVVKVLWINSCNSNLNWTIAEDIDVEPMYIDSFGVVVKDTDEFLAIAQNYSNNPEKYSNIITIPKGCIKEVFVIHEDCVCENDQKPVESPRDYHDIDPHFGIPVEDLMSKEKTANRIKPKRFNVGDWIVNNKHKDVFFINNITSRYCTLEDTKGIIYQPPLPLDENDYHLWTIEDAKDGDVLVVERDKTPFIFKEFDKFHPGCPVAYCGIDDSGIFVNSGDGWWTDEKVYPATKEQRDQLEKAMADAGYKFDFEKKELEIANFSKNLKYSPDTPSIIEYKSAWSEDDEKMFRSLSNSLARISSTTRTDSTSVNYTFFAEIDWLKSLKDRVQPQPKEWSEEDENKLSAIIEEGYLKPSERQWLKSLKNRVQPNLKID